MMNQAQLGQLKTRLARIADLNGSASVLGWDQETMMPEGGVQARADQMSTLGGLAHEYFVDEEVGQLLEDLAGQSAEADFETDDASLVRVKRREYEKQVRVPTELVMELLSVSAVATEAWKKARTDHNFSIFQPHLEKIMDIQRRIADALGYEGNNPYDALLDSFEPGTTYENISAVFSQVRGPVVELIKTITERGKPVDETILAGDYPADKQLAFSRQVAEALGYDFEHGRLDLSAHPFTTSFAYSDVRLTTRVKPHDLVTCLMGVIHEAGHGMHGQGLSPQLYRTTIEQTGLATAESQSRFYENMVGRSRAFWTYWYPRLQETFPNFKPVAFEDFYRALNQVKPGLIRVEADEVTYGLHIMLRFELENDILNNRVQVKDLPREWNDRMEALLGVRPPNDSDGVLQDIHWSGGGVGYFPDYWLGSIFAAQLWEQIVKERPSTEKDIAAGEYKGTLGWLREKIHTHGNKFTFPELVKRVTGGPLRWEPYVNYLQKKYGAIYGL